MCASTTTAYESGQTNGDEDAANNFLGCRKRGGGDVAAGSWPGGLGSLDDDGPLVVAGRHLQRVSACRSAMAPVPSECRRAVVDERASPERSVGPALGCCSIACRSPVEDERDLPVSPLGGAVRRGAVICDLEAL